MNKYFIILVLLTIQACKTNNSKSNPAGENNPVTDSFFPVTSYIRGQILTLDSLPVTPLKITTIKGKADSIWLTKEKLKPLLQPFLEPNISETNMLAYFKETSFNDQTLNAITFTYEPVKNLPPSISLRHWDVYIDPAKGHVTKVFLVKRIKSNNQDITLQLTWQSNKLANIATILNRSDNTVELLKEEKFIWDFD